MSQCGPTSAFTKEPPCVYTMCHGRRWRRGVSVYTRCPCTRSSLTSTRRRRARRIGGGSGEVLAARAGVGEAAQGAGQRGGRGVGPRAVRASQLLGAPGGTTAYGHDEVRR